MRCHKCDEGVLQIEPINSPEPGWFAQCNRCHYHTRFPAADQMVTAQPMTSPPEIKRKIKRIPQRESSYQGLSEHSLDCPWHKDWHACNCGLFENKEDEEIKHDRVHKDIGNARPASGEALDIVAFEKGYNDGKDDYLCGGNTPGRVEEQIEWLERIAKQKEVESAAVKAAHKVMEQHSEAFEKLAENKE